MRRTTLLLTAAIGAAALLAFLYPSMKVNAADVAMRVEGEDFATKPAGYSVVSGAGYSGGAALKFTQNNTASHTITCSATCDVVLMASGGQSGGQPTLRVNGSPAQALTSTTVKAYTFDVNLPAGQQNTINVTAGNTGTGRNAVLDVVTFPASDGGGGGTDRDADGVVDTTDNCPDVFNPQQADGDGDGIGNKCDDGSTPPTDTDGDGVPDSTDECDAQPGPAPSGCPLATSSAVLIGAGDISSGGSRDQDTGDLVRTQLNGGAWGIFTTGDNAYPDGTYQNYQVYDAAWGSFRSKTRPTYGNHDYYGSSTAVGSGQYWNEGPDPTPVRVSNAESFYAYDVGNSNWRTIVLNSASSEGPTSNQAPSCAAGSPQMNFLNNELNTTKNTVLFWHHARFSASTDHPTSEGVTGCSKTFFDVAFDNGADLVLQGHSHLYERYDTRDKIGTRVAGGLTSIVCGTGGNSFDGLQGSPSPAYDRAFTNAWGVCKLTLSADKAQVDFLPAPGSPSLGRDSATVAVRP